MVIENFKLIKTPGHQIIELEYQGEVFDLHNAAQFIKFDYSIGQSILTLYWRYYLEDNNFDYFQLLFINTSYLEIIPRDGDMPIEEDDCLEQIFYNERLELKFMGGMKIVVESELVKFVKELHEA